MPLASAPQAGLRLLKGHGNFARFDVPASIVDMLGLQLPALALVALFGPATGGIYFLAERVLTAPMGIISQALAQAVLAGARETNQRGQMMRQTIRIILARLAVLAVPVAVIGVGGEHLFAAIFDDSWRTAGVYAAWLMPGFALQFVYSSISTTRVATKGQKTNLLIHSVLLAFKALALWVGYRAGDPLHCIIALSVANIAGGVLSIGMVMRHLARAGSARRRPEPV